MATLVVAAAFNPVRRRLQNVVDRRFNRRRFDAVRTVDNFAQSLRSEVDLDRLVGQLRLVVQRSLEPVAMHIWLREPADR